MYSYHNKTVLIVEFSYTLCLETGEFLKPERPNPRKTLSCQKIRAHYSGIGKKLTINTVSFKQF